MSKSTSIINLILACYFIIAITYHFIWPGQNYEYTEALLLNLILMPTLCFLLGSIPKLKSYDRTTIVLVLMALGIAGVWVNITLGLWGGLWLMLYLYPIVQAFGNATDSTIASEVKRIGLSYFIAFGLAFLIYMLCLSFSISVFDSQEEHFGHVWEDYGDGVVLMLTASLFAIFNYIPILRDAVRKL